MSNNNDLKNIISMMKWIRENMTVVLLIVNMIGTSGILWLNSKYQTIDRADREKVEMMTVIKANDINNSSQHAQLFTTLTAINLTLAKMEQNEKSLVDHESRLRTVENSANINSIRLKILEENKRN